MRKINRYSIFSINQSENRRKKLNKKGKMCKKRINRKKMQGSQWFCTRIWIVLFKIFRMKLCRFRKKSKIFWICL